MMKSKRSLALLFTLCMSGVAGWAQEQERLTFGVISDIHFGDAVGEGATVKVPKALKNLTSQGKLDALAVVGDLTNGGAEDQYAELVQVFSDEQTFANPVGKFLFMMGNHDNYDSNGKNNYQEGLKVFNDGELYPFHTYQVIKGYPFLTVSVFSGTSTDISNPGNGMAAYPTATVEWVRQNLEKAAKECPGKPIFVFTHVPPRWTCYSTWAELENGEAWCMKVLNPVLNQYPQAVVFGGHSHYPMGDPRSIHQGVNPASERNNYYTVINTGSTTYSEIHPGAVDVGIHPYRYDYVTEGLILEELENGDIEVRRYDTYRNEEIGAEHRWVLKAPFDGSMFQYGDVRDADDNPQGRALRTGLPAPAFAEGTALDVTPASYDAQILIPQAKDDECVFNYEITVKSSSKNVVVSEGSVFSQFYLNSEMPENIAYKISGLEPENDYEVEVTAYDSYGNASETLKSTFSTVEDNDPANDVPDAYERWTFDNADNALSTEYGHAALDPLTVDGKTLISHQDITSAGMQVVEGPTEENNALFVPASAGLKAYLYLDGSSEDYTLQMDLRVKNANPYNALFQTNLENSDDAEMFIHSGKVGVAVLGYSGEVRDNTWHRFLFVFQDGELSVYVDGKFVSSASNERWKLTPEGVLLLVDNDGERQDTEVAEIAFWNQALTEGQIHRLGKIGLGEYMEVLTPKVQLIDKTDFEVNINTNVPVSFELPEWIEGVDVQPAVGPKAYSFRATPLTEVGRRKGTISVLSEEFPTQRIEVTQICLGDAVPEATGRWTFDNPDNLQEGTGVATLFGALNSVDGAQRTATLEEADIVALTEGPTEGNGAIGIPVNSYLWMNTNSGEDLLTSYTLMIDVRPEKLDGFNSLYLNSTDISQDGSLFVKNGQIGLASSGLGYNGDMIPTKWHRIVTVVRDSYISVYIDGEKVGQSTSANSFSWDLHPEMLFFADNSMEEVWNDVAEIRFWDVPLNDDMVKELGAVDQAEVNLDPIPDATTIWTFDDASSPLTGTGDAELYGAVRGEDGTPQRVEDLAAAGIVAAPGPYDGNAALTVPVNSYLGINHNQDELSLKSFTILMDIRPKDLSGFQSIYQSITDNSSDASLFLRNDEIGVNDSGLGYGGSLKSNTWHRIVFVSEGCYLSVYIDGVLTVKSSSANTSKWSLNNGSLFFADNDAEEGVIDIAELRFWNEGLTSYMVKQLGGVPTSTGIGSVTDRVPSSQAVYDLFGRRIADKNLRKGIYIIGGRKVVVR